MTKYIYVLILILVGFSPLSLFAQLTTTGSGIALAQCGCYQLTNNVGNQKGGAYNPVPIAVNAPFNLKFSVNFGANDFGGEGMVLSFQDPAGGWDASGLGKWGLGIGGTPNEVHIEFDTRYSHLECACSNGDSGIDHIGIFKNGGFVHNGPDDSIIPAGTQPLIGGLSNVEDGNFHNIEVVYDGLIISIYVDGETVASHSQPLNITSNTGGTGMALWGWTAATPNAASISNKQTICLANSPTFDYSIVNCQNISMDFNAQAFSFNPIVNYQWYFDGVAGGNTQTVAHTFPNSGYHEVIIRTEDNTGCFGSDTVTIGVGFNIQTSMNEDTVCPGGTVNLESDAVFFVPPTCNYKLMMGDAFCDGWAGSNIKVFVDGVLFGTYSPPNVGCGGAGWQEFKDLILPDGAVVDITFTYAGVFGSEMYYTVEDPSGNIFINHTQGSINGNLTDNFTVDCGITATTYSYQWKDITHAITGPAAANWTGATVPDVTEFEIMVTNNNTGCIVGDTLTVNVYDPVEATITSGNQTICAGQTTTIDVAFIGNPPFSLTYSGPGGPQTVNGITGMTHQITVSTGGTYTITSIIGSGCPGTITAPTSVQITVIPLPNVQISGNATYCQGDVMANINVTSATGGSVFWWDNLASVGDTMNAIGTGNSFDPNTQGYTSTTTIYAQQFSIPTGCTGTPDDVVLTILPIPTAPTIIGTNTYCDGDSFTALSISPAPGGTVRWYKDTTAAPVGSSTSIIPSGLIVGVNTYFAIVNNGTCDGPFTQYNITVKPRPTAPAVTGDTTYCTSDLITPLTATPTIGGLITWNTGATGNNLTPTLVVGMTMYCVNETLNGCTGPNKCVNVTFYVDPTVTVPTTSTICIGDSILICAENNGQFPPDMLVWAHGPTSECIYLGPPANEQYTVCLTNPACGTTCDTINIIVKPLPIVVAGDDQITGLGGEVNMWATGASSYVWSPSITNCGTCSFVYTVPSQTTSYVATGTDENGCKNSDTVTITINGEMIVYIANIFSPNGDNRNDMLYVQGPRLTQFSFMIFDRWGRKMFETEDQKQGWDGTFNGEPLSQQVFAYVVKGVDVLGRAVKIGGNVMLAR